MFYYLSFLTLALNVRFILINQSINQSLVTNINKKFQISKQSLRILIQVQVQDNMVSVIEDSKDQKELIASQLAQAQVQLSENQQLHPQTLTVQQLQHLQVQQVLDNVVRMESSVDNQQNQSSGDNDPMSDNMHIIKDEKVLQNCTRLLGAQFGLQVCFRLANNNNNSSLYEYPKGSETFSLSCIDSMGKIYLYHVKLDMCWQFVFAFIRDSFYTFVIILKIYLIQKILMHVFNCFKKSLNQNFHKAVISF